VKFASGLGRGTRCDACTPWHAANGRLQLPRRRMKLAGSAANTQTLRFRWARRRAWASLGEPSPELSFSRYSSGACVLDSHVDIGSRLSAQRPASLGWSAGRLIPDVDVPVY
jgi:hypothetical protein